MSPSFNGVLLFILSYCAFDIASSHKCANTVIHFGHHTKKSKKIGSGSVKIGK